MWRTLAWDVLAVLALSVYGTQVCPLMAGVGVPRLSVDVTVAFVISQVVFVPLVARVVDRAPADRRSGRTYLTTLARFSLSGLGLALYDVLLLHYPTSSGVKLLIGAIALGHFVGVDLALATERKVIAGVASDARTSRTAIPEPRSLVRRLALFAVATVVLVAAVLVFIVTHDLDVLTGTSAGAVGAARTAIVVEIGTVGVVLAVLVLNVIVGLARNVSLLFANETRVLQAVGRGELGAGVPVLGDDEFGVIAAHTNHMIEGLRERRKVREALGKIVSPDIARALLDGESGLSLGGTRQTLTLLFSDIRGFTSWSEGTEPEQLVRDLNRYFTAMVAIVHEEGGVVDKFIGDGMMAVFGLGAKDAASFGATRAARRMIESVASMGPELTQPIRIGVGVHRGAVIAGNIGSPERLEFTVIGDAVNTAARLESLTARVGVAILVSTAVLDDLPEEERARWESRGTHELKGKTAAVEVHTPRG